MMAFVVVGFAVGGRCWRSHKLTVQLGGGLNLGRKWWWEVVMRSLECCCCCSKLVKSTHTEQEPPHVLQDLRDGLQYLGQNSRIHCPGPTRNCFFRLCCLSCLAVRMAEVIPGMKSSQFGFFCWLGALVLPLVQRFWVRVSAFPILS